MIETDELNVLNSNVIFQTWKITRKLEATNKAEAVLAVSRYSCQHSWASAEEVLLWQKTKRCCTSSHQNICHLVIFRWMASDYTMRLLSGGGFKTPNSGYMNTYGGRNYSPNHFSLFTESFLPKKEKLFTLYCRLMSQNYDSKNIPIMTAFTFEVVIIWFIVDCL